MRISFSTTGARWPSAPSGTLQRSALAEHPVRHAAENRHDASGGRAPHRRRPDLRRAFPAVLRYDAVRRFSQALCGGSRAGPPACPLRPAACAPGPPRPGGPPFKFPRGSSLSFSKGKWGLLKFVGAVGAFRTGPEDGCRALKLHSLTGHFKKTYTLQ